MAWAWTLLKDAALDAVLRPAMKGLEDELKRGEKYLPPQAKVRTTDATVTTLYTAAIPVNESVIVTGHVVARRTGGTAGAANDGAGYVVEFCAKNTAGTAGLIGAGSVTVLGESQAGGNCTLTASGGSILVRVTGAVDNNVTWSWSGKRLSVKE